MFIKQTLVSSEHGKQDTNYFLMYPPGIFFVYFQSFQSKITILQQINLNNVHPI